MNKQNGIYKKSAEFGQTEGSSLGSFNDMVYGQRMIGYITGTDDIKASDFSDFNADDKSIMILVSAIKVRDYRDMYLIKNSAQKLLERVRVCEIAGKHIVVVSGVTDIDTLSEQLILLKSELDKHFTYKADIMYSKPAAIRDFPKVYELLAQKIEYAFYCDGQGVYNAEQFQTGGGTALQEYEGLGNALKLGDEINTKAILEDFFESIKQTRPEPGEARLSCYQLYACIITYCPQDMLEPYMSQISKFSRFTNIYEIERFIIDRAMEIVSENDPHNEKSYSNLIKNTVKLINENIGNENLSLRWLAGNILFTNVDYLGKLFKKETGKNFSYYVMEKRMELAKTLMVKKERVYEVAQKVGYGSNSQYFSHVFKKYTGVSPLEYKEFARANQAKGK